MSHDLSVEDRKFGRRFRHEYVLRPDQARMRLDPKRKRLVYDTGVLVVDRLQTNCLDRFLHVDDAKPEAILAFAQANGVLGPLNEEGVSSESLRIWRSLARRARTTLRIALCVEQQSATAETDWEQLKHWWRAGPDRRGLSRTERDREQLADVLNAWLKRAALRPWFSWHGRFGSILLTNVEGFDEGAVTLLGALAQQIVLASTHGRTIATCSWCGRIYARTRRAPVGQSNYCTECGIKAAWRNAQARRRAKLARARSH